MPSDPDEETREVPMDPEEETREVPLDPEERTQEAPSYTAEETQEAPSDREDEVQGTPSDSEEEILEAPSDPEEETLEAPSDFEEAKYVAGLAEGPTDLDGPVIPALRKLTIGGNFPPNNINAPMESAGAHTRGRSSTAKFSADERGRQRRDCVDVRRRGHDDFVAAKGGEMYHFDAEQAFLKANIDEGVYIEIPEEYEKFPGAVRLLYKAIYGLVQTGRCWNNKFCNDMTAIGFEQSKVDPCMFRKIADKETEMVVVVHVDDILAHAKDQATMERFAAELGRKFKLKDVGDAKHYMGCHIIRDRKARPPLIREVDGGEVRRKEGKQGTSVFRGYRPFL